MMTSEQLVWRQKIVTTPVPRPEHFNSRVTSAVNSRSPGPLVATEMTAW